MSLLVQEANVRYFPDLRKQKGDFELADDEVEPKKEAGDWEKMFGMFHSGMEKQFALREKELKLWEREMEIAEERHKADMEEQRLCLQHFLKKDNIR